MNILDKILIQKKNHYKYLEQKIKKITLNKKMKPIFFQTIQNELKKNKNALIVEFKRFSPSVNSFKRIQNLFLFFCLYLVKIKCLNERSLYFFFRYLPY